MNVVLTGASGFIGSHLAERLLRQGSEVTGIDCFLDYYPRIIKERNLRGFLDHPGFTFVEADVAELDWSEILRGKDAVFHQAAIAGVRASWGSRFNEYAKNNILGTQLILEASKEANLKKFVYASSSSVYGNAESLPIDEATPARPISPYGVSKLAGEHLVSLYHKAYGVPTVSLRYFTVYGPRQRPDMAFHKFIKAVHAGELIEVYGDGAQTRDFTYIDDAVSANLSALTGGRPGGIYNIGGGSKIKLIDAIRLIENVVGRKADIRYADKQKGDAAHTYANVTLAENDLNYSPSYDLERGLTEQYCWIRDNMDIYG